MVSDGFNDEALIPTKETDNNQTIIAGVNIVEE